MAGNAFSQQTRLSMQFENYNSAANWIAQKETHPVRLNSLDFRPRYTDTSIILTNDSEPVPAFWSDLAFNFEPGDFKTLTFLGRLDYVTNLNTLTNLKYAGFGGGFVVAPQLPDSLENIDITDGGTITPTPDFSNTVLRGVIVQSTHSFDPSALDGQTSLFDIRIQYSSLTTCCTLSNKANLASLRLEDNSLASIPSVAGLANLTTVILTGNALTASAVNNILIQLDANGAAGGTCDLSGGTNGTPTGAGLTAKTNLEAKGWTITVNP